MSQSFHLDEEPQQSGFLDGQGNIISPHNKNHLKGRGIRPVQRTEPLLDQEKPETPMAGGEAVRPKVQSKDDLLGIRGLDPDRRRIL